MELRDCGTRAHAEIAVQLELDAIFDLQLELGLLKSSFMYAVLLFLAFSWTWRY